MTQPEREPLPPPVDTDPLAPDVPALGDLDAAAGGTAINERDRVPQWLMRSQGRIEGIFSAESRVVLSAVVVLMAVVAALIIASTRLLSEIVEALNLISMLGLFLVNWIGNGGALVPIPGARFIGLLMIFQHAVMYPSWEVFGVAGAAMGLGLLSYYIAGARAAQSYAAGDRAGAEQVARDTGMLEDSEDGDSGGGGDSPSQPSLLDRAKGRFSESFESAQDRAQPIIEKHGVSGMALLCFGPSPLGTAAAFLGGLMRFGFVRYLGASFGAKYLLAGIIVLAGLALSDVARSIQIPQLLPL